MDDRAMKRLAAAVRQRRGQLGLNQEQLADASGLGVQTIRQIEKERQRSARTTTLSALDVGLQWQEGSAQAIVDGDQPVVTPIWYLSELRKNHGGAPTLLSVPDDPEDEPPSDPGGYLTRKLDDVPIGEASADELLRAYAEKIARDNPNSPHNRPKKE